MPGSQSRLLGIRVTVSLVGTRQKLIPESDPDVLACQTATGHVISGKDFDGDYST